MKKHIFLYNSIFFKIMLIFFMGNIKSGEKPEKRPNLRPTFIGGSIRPYQDSDEESDSKSEDKIPVPHARSQRVLAEPPLSRFLRTSLKPKENSSFQNVTATTKPPLARSLSQRNLLAVPTRRDSQLFGIWSDSSSESEPSLKDRVSLPNVPQKATPSTGGAALDTESSSNSDNPKLPIKNIDSRHSRIKVNSLIRSVFSKESMDYKKNKLKQPRLIQPKSYSRIIPDYINSNSRLAELDAKSKSNRERKNSILKDIGLTIGCTLVAIYSYDHVSNPTIYHGAHRSTLDNTSAPTETAILSKLGAAISLGVASGILLYSTASLLFLHNSKKKC